MNVLNIRGKKVFFYYCAWQKFHLAPTYLQVRWRNQSYVVLGKKCLCVDWFYLWKWFGRAWAKSLLKKGGGFTLGRWHPFKKKLNARGREKKICLKKNGRTHIWAMTSVWEKIKRAWTWKKEFWLVLVQQNKWYFIYIEPEHFGEWLYKQNEKNDVKMN